MARTHARLPEMKQPVREHHASRRSRPKGRPWWRMFLVAVVALAGVFLGVALWLAFGNAGAPPP